MAAFVIVIYSSQWLKGSRRGCKMLSSACSRSRKAGRIIPKHNQFCINYNCYSVIRTVGHRHHRPLPPHQRTERTLLLACFLRPHTCSHCVTVYCGGCYPAVTACLLGFFHMGSLVSSPSDFACLWSENHRAWKRGWEDANTRCKWPWIKARSFSLWGDSATCWATEPPIQEKNN